MRRPGRGIATLALVCALTVPGVATAQGPGEIGGPPSGESIGLPTFKGKGLKGFPRPRSKPIVIGVGPTFLGPVEIIGQDTTLGLCVIVYQPKVGTFYGECPIAAPPAGEPIRAGTFEWGPRRRNGIYGGVSGIASAQTSSVVIAIENEGKRKNVRAVVANPDAAIRQRLGIAEPLAYFHASYPGCVQPQKTISLAYDALGAQLGSFRGRKSSRGARRCRAARRGTSTLAGGNTTGSSTLTLVGVTAVAMTSGRSAGPTPPYAMSVAAPKPSSIRWRGAVPPAAQLPGR